MKLLTLIFILILSQGAIFFAKYETNPIPALLLGALFWGVATAFSEGEEGPIPPIALLGMVIFVPWLLVLRFVFYPQ